MTRPALVLVLTLAGCGPGLQTVIEVVSEDDGVGGGQQLVCYGFCYLFDVLTTGGGEIERTVEAR